MIEPVPEPRPLSLDGCGLQSLGRAAELCSQCLPSAPAPGFWQAVAGTHFWWLVSSAKGMCDPTEPRMSVPSKTSSVSGCCPHLEVSTVTSLPPFGDRGLGESVI